MPINNCLCFIDKEITQDDLKYVNMCKKAVEIQNSWKPKELDNIFFNPMEKIAFLTDGVLDCFLPISKRYSVWLPTQEQLQKMMGDFSLIETKRFSYFHYFCTKKDIDISSWDQLWLSLIMAEKYNKLWIKPDEEGEEDWIISKQWNSIREIIREEKGIPI